MEVIITKKARDDLNDYQYHSKVSSAKYVSRLLKYASTVSKMPNIGKVVYNVKKYQIRQLIYMKHRILYMIYHQKVYILDFIHTSRNFNIQKYFNLIQFPKL